MNRETESPAPGSLAARYAALLRVSDAVSVHRDLRSLLRELACRLPEVVAFDGLWLSLHDESRELMRVHAIETMLAHSLPATIEIPCDESPSGLVYETQQPLIIGHVGAETRFPHAIELLRRVGVESCCVVPLTTALRRVGTLAFASQRQNAYGESDLEFLRRVANLVAVAVDNALAIEHLERHHEDLARAYRDIEQLNEKLAGEKLYLEEEIRGKYNFEEIVGTSEALKSVLAQVETVAPTDSTVLILGETGTGKELIARAIHDASARKGRTLVKVNCAAIPTGLLESELFGHERGAFTGAIAQKIGRFELAHHGTLFLDEVGDIPLELQAKLLRVLQEREFERLGSSRSIRVDVRLVAATNRDLGRMVADREFRSDLFYRLNVFPIVIPPLRTRPEDIAVLVRYFTQKYARRMNRPIDTIPNQALDALVRWPWPGNVRELENVIERAVILSRGHVLQVPVSELQVTSPETPRSADSTLEAVERDHIVRTLNDTDWMIGGARGAAKRLGVKRTTLIAKMRRLGIERPSRSLSPAGEGVPPPQPARLSRPWHVSK